MGVVMRSEESCFEELRCCLGCGAYCAKELAKMRCRLLATLAAWSAFGFLSVAAQEPNLLPTPDEGTVVNDAHLPGGEHVVGGGGLAGDAQFGGYPYSGGWHAGYQHPMYGAPVALVVPPVSHYQVIYGWGIGSTQVTPIYPQFGGPGYGTPYGDAGQYAFPPYWPWDTRQFGVYYIRGPW
jgi:hypothetical protein